MKKIILTTFILLVAVFAVAYLYFSNLAAGNKNSSKVLSMIPADAGLLFEFKNDKGFYEIFSDYPLFNAVIGKQRAEELSVLKNALAGNRQLLKLTQNQPVFLSFHPSTKDSLDFLWSMPLNRGLKDNQLLSALKSNRNDQISTAELNGNQVVRIRFATLNKDFYLYVRDEIALGSFSGELLLRSLDNKGQKMAPDFVALANSASVKNDNSPANIFIDYKTLGPFIGTFFKQKLNGSFALLNNFQGLSTLNMNFKSDALMFNGITNSDTSRANYLNLFLHQQPVKCYIKRIAPDNTSGFIAYGLSSYPQFFGDLKQLFGRRKEYGRLKSQIDSIRSSTGINPERDIKPLWGNEFITFQRSTQEKLAAIRTSNGERLQFLLEPLSSNYGGKIWRLDYPGLLYYYFGDPLKNFNKPFFAITDNMLIVSNSPNSVQRFLNDYNAERFLSKSQKFSNFDQLVADQSNILLFIHAKNSGSNIQSLLKPAYAKNFRSTEFGLKDFYGISFQWSSDKDRFFSNFYAGYKQKDIESLPDAQNDSLRTEQ